MFTIRRSLLVLVTLLAVAGFLFLPGVLGQLPERTRDKAPATPASAAATAPAPAPTPLPPPPELVLQPAEVKQGDFAVLTLTGQNLADPGVQVPGLPPQPGFFQLGGRLVALVGVPASQKTGDYLIYAYWDGGSTRAHLKVLPQKFPEEHLEVSASENAIRTDPRQEDDAKKVALVHSHPAPEPLWSGPFIWPVRGEITTAFGEKRYVNGDFSSYHTGLDIGAPAGTPVLATGTGKVVLAEHLVLTGNTVIIDHGLGLFSFYGHMQSLAVKVGDAVDRGQMIGKVGSTGFSTGPHLHWTMTLRDVPVDPGRFIDHTLLDR